MKNFERARYIAVVVYADSAPSVLYVDSVLVILSPSQSPHYWVTDTTYYVDGGSVSARANGDGIGDAPYVIDGANVDNYPLMFPYDVENDTVVLPPFSTTLVVAAVAVAVIGVGLLVYFKRRKHQTK